MSSGACLVPSSIRTPHTNLLDDRMCLETWKRLNHVTVFHLNTTENNWRLQTDEVLTDCMIGLKRQKEKPQELRADNHNCADSLVPVSPVQPDWLVVLLAVPTVPFIMHPACWSSFSTYFQPLILMTRLVSLSLHSWNTENVVFLNPAPLSKCYLTVLPVAAQRCAWTWLMAL